MKKVFAFVVILIAALGLERGCLGCHSDPAKAELTQRKVDDRVAASFCAFYSRCHERAVDKVFGPGDDGRQFCARYNADALCVSQQHAMCAGEFAGDHAAVDECEQEFAALECDAEGIPDSCIESIVAE